MADYLLVHGAWGGAWYWRDTLATLTRAGHRAHAVTLTGVGERAHLLTPAIDLETHVADVLGALDAEELQGCILVVHSYAGMLGTAVADRRPGQIRHLVYVDAVLPEPGESWSSGQPADTRAARIASAEADPNYAFAAPDPAAFGLTGPAADCAQDLGRDRAHQWPPEEEGQGAADRRSGADRGEPGQPGHAEGGAR